MAITMSLLRLKKNYRPLLILLGILLIIFFNWHALTPLSQPNNLNEYNPTERVKTQYAPHRELYGTMPNGLPVTDAFKELPPLPENFGIYMYNMMERGLSTYCDITPDYYLQPEFISGNNWLRMAGSYWTEPDPTHVTDTGKGGWPQIQRIDVYRTDKPVEGLACAFLFSGWGIWKYMGAHPYAYFMPKGARQQLDGSCTAYDALVPKGLESELTVQVTPDEFIIPPNYPILKKDWLQKVEVSIHVSKKVPPGTYAIGIDLTKPKPETDQRFLSETLTNGEFYTVPSDLFKTVICGVPTPPVQFELVVH